MKKEPRLGGCTLPPVVLRKPTRGDLIALINWAAGEAGSALAEYWNDRDDNRADTLKKRLAPMQEKLLTAAAYFPVPRKSPWVSTENHTPHTRSTSGQNTVENKNGELR